ncbi:serine O-acetyltransferase [Arabiibacter massiliensis]|uniref:serine O-acetyltransferase n=1 Tax=Arabiibacter massiliensis TaxID=1870985 RepID=UPI0018D5DDF6|nr:serine acetyltransferase [Arabiibacter massiliensis]
MANLMNAVNKYRRARWCYTHGLKPLARLIEMEIYLVHNSFIPSSCELGEGTVFGYKGIGVVIHKRAKVGRDCLIGQQVTIGGRSGHQSVPVIGDKCEICAGAKVLGPITLGNSVVIGANAVMLSDAPDGTVWAGVPARCISSAKPNKSMHASS